MMYVKQWFASKELNLEEYQAASNSNFAFVVVKETEKAVNGYYDTDFGRIYKWIPKACLSEESEAETGYSIYLKVLASAKAKGVKGVYEGLKLSTIRSKAKQQGIEL